MPKSAKSKKNKKALKAKTSSEIFLEQLTIVTAERMKREIWSVIDAQMKTKLTRREKKKLAQKRAEELKIVVEQERLRLLEEDRLQQEEERRLSIEKSIRDKIEQGIRVDQLNESCNYIVDLNDEYFKMEIDSMAEAEWQEYLKCEGLPNPANCGAMNTYLHLWDKVKETTSITECCNKSTEVLSLLDTLDDLLECPAISDKKKVEWLAVRNSFRFYQQYNLDCAAYRLLRDIDTHLLRIDIPTATYAIKQKDFSISLWVLIQTPIATPNPKKPPRPPTALKFPDLKMEVAFPGSIDVWALCVRSMFITYDHYSYMCHTFDPPPIPAALNRDLNKTTQEEWVKKLEVIQIELERRSKEAEQEKLAGLPPNKKKKIFEKIEHSLIYVSIEDEIYLKYRENLCISVAEHEINLRKYRIIGGVYFLDLFFQPPQPTTLIMRDITISTLSIPKWLYEVPFHVEYIPPPPPEEGKVRKPEEIEADIKQQEKEYEKLIYITLSLPNTVFWLDVPIVCQWDDEKNIWTTQDIHDTKHIEEKQIVQFRTGKFGPFAMAIYKYSSLPFQAWELKPGPDETVILSIIAAVLVIEFTVKNDLICVSQLQNAPNFALGQIIGVYYKLPKLKRILQTRGVDIFPEPDAFCYTEGACEKQWPMENHLYYTMGRCCTYYNFAWSRWNLLAGRRNIVMQVREWSQSERVKQPNYSMLLVTPLRAMLVDCTEVSAEFNEEGEARMKFYSDFYHLVVGISSIAMKKKLQKVNTKLSNAVALLLKATRIVSYS